jgi:hypothetical protein
MHPVPAFWIGAETGIDICLRTIIRYPEIGHGVVLVKPSGVTWSQITVRRLIYE